MVRGHSPTATSGTCARRATVPAVSARCSCRGPRPLGSGDPPDASRHKPAAEAHEGVAIPSEIARNDWKAGTMRAHGSFEQMYDDLGASHHRRLLQRSP